MAEAAFTEAGAIYPGYVNLKKVDNGFVLTVRGPVKGDGGNTIGDTVQLKLTPADLRQWLGDVNNLYAAYHGGHL